jgi:hypothetical protein
MTSLAGMNQMAHIAAQWVAATKMRSCQYDSALCESRVFSIFLNAAARPSGKAMKSAEPTAFTSIARPLANLLDHPFPVCWIFFVIYRHISPLALSPKIPLSPRGIGGLVRISFALQPFLKRKEIVVLSIPVCLDQFLIVFVSPLNSRNTLSLLFDPCSALEAHLQLDGL